MDPFQSDLDYYKNAMALYTKSLGKCYSNRDIELMRFKVKCLINNPEYVKAAKNYYDGFEELSDEQKVKHRSDFTEKFGIEYPNSPKSLKWYLKNKDWRGLKCLFWDLLPYTVVVKDAPQTVEEIDAEIALAGKERSVELNKLRDKWIQWQSEITDITIKINLTASNKRIIEEINAILLKYKKRVPPKDDLNFYNRCLDHYLLKKRKKLTFEKLAELLYPSSNLKSRRDPDVVVTQLKRECKRAKQLLDGGYKDLR